MDYQAMAQEIIDGASELRGLKLKDLKNAQTALPLVLLAVEARGRAKSLTGADKRELAVAVLNRLLDMPYLPEELEAALLRRLVDAAVSALNGISGKRWADSGK
ncbi:MAG: hypothetical protein GX410_01120 [Elusimicrobia bacterium]|nr:hypothetical protein [Elusimicrobiota bacterium]